MDLATQLREKGDSCALIFVTSSDAFAVASYDVQAAYYLLKPLDTNKLTKVLDSIQIKRAQDTRCLLYTSENLQFFASPYGSHFQIDPVVYNMTNNRSIHFP